MHFFITNDIIRNAYNGNEILIKYSKAIHMRCIVLIYMYMYMCTRYSTKQIQRQGTNEYRKIYNTSDFQKSLKTI